MKKVVFRVSLLPMIQILSALMVNMFFVAVLFMMFALYGYMPSIYNLQVFYYLFGSICLVFGLSLVTSSPVVFMKDVGQLVAMLIQFGLGYAYLLEPEADTGKLSMGVQAKSYVLYYWGL